MSTPIQNEHLPEDVIVNNILSRLPVKSLLRFKCVSKRWRFLLSDPEFAKFHLKIASQQQTLKHRLLIATAASRFLSIDLETPPPPPRTSGDDDDKCRSLRNLTFPAFNRQPDQPPSPPLVVGSCNGLVCVALAFHKSFCIFNPSTGFSHKLPDPEFVPQSIHGFGYVSATDDYKVVVGDFDRTRECGHFGIFSLRANSWKRIQIPITLFRMCNGALFREALHWICPVSKPPHRQAIFAFDLEKEEFRQLSLPDFSKSYFPDMGILLEGFLGARCRGRDVFCDEIWVMREYDVPESWTMLYKLNMNDPPQPISRSQPILYRECGVVVYDVMYDLGGMVTNLKWFDNKEDKFGKGVVYSGAYVLEEKITSHYNIIEYVESLLSFSSNISGS